MSGRLSESDIVRKVADIAATRVARKIISHIQRMPFAGLSGDDSELENTWDEICAQVQYEESIAWEAYGEMFDVVVRGFIEKLPSHEREALWLQTDVGIEWLLEEQDDRVPYPVCTDDTVSHVLREYVYPEAGRWSNRRIRAYIDRASARD